ncbi:uncharacterized protein SRS1_14124 [Sporisorium reilianum f. sp. reilianum]|uniref:Uncharacterized protein n=1 Tax=Sporisorium reilianum f. sp. reilianum TaxID=72559 RepID=A0A2N8UFY2_9BASI|nr:uncharacterized protein SRS1_14124 [Sporisorium reilianum f. sp. reilianum]
MRLSSSLYLILAAITMANAAVVDTVDTVAHPKHKMVRVKNGAAHVNALNTAKVNLDKLDAAKLDHLVSVAARRSVDVEALGAAHADVKTVDLKHVASIVHTLSASLEGHNAAADKILKIKDHKLAAVKTKKLLHGVKHELAHAVVDIKGLTKAKADHKSAVSVQALRRSVAHLESVVALVKSTKISGAAGLVSLLSGIKVDALLESDVVSVLAEVDVLKVLHDVAGIDTVLTAVLAVPESVALLENIQQLDDPVAFVGALVDVHSLTALVAAVPGGVNEIVKVEGAAKMVDYVGKYGSATVTRIFETVGVESVLKAVVALPSSVKLLEAVKSVVDVPALVSGLHVLNAVAFVESIKAVDDVAVLTNAVLNVVDKTLSKRAELLQTVDGTVSGVTSAVDVDQVLSLVKRAELLDTATGTVSGLTSSLGLQKVLKLKRAIAHISALPDSDLVSIDQAVKRALIDNVDVSDVLDNVDIAKLGLLKRSILDLSSVVHTKELDGLVEKVVKREDVASFNENKLIDLDSILGVLKRDVESANENKLIDVDSLLAVIKRDVESANENKMIDVDSLLSVLKRDTTATSTNELVDLNALLSVLKRSMPLTHTSDLGLISLVPTVKRAITAATRPHTVDYTTLHARHTAGALLTDAVDTLLPTVSTLLTKIVHITDAIHVDAVTLDVKQKVLPLVAAVGSVLDSVVSVQAPGLHAKVHKIGKLANKTVKALP